MADGFSIQVPNPFAWLVAPAPAPAAEAEPKPKGPVYRNEFTKLSYEFVSDLAFFRDKYPLISLITVVAFSVFSMSSFFSFTFVGFVSAGLYGSVSYSMAKAIGAKGGPFWSSVAGSIGEVLQSFALGRVEAG